MHTTVHVPSYSTLAGDRIALSPCGNLSPVGVVVGISVYAAALAILGGLMLATGEMTAFGVALLVEAAVRAATAVGVGYRRRAWHMVGIVHSGLSFVSATASLPLGLIGIAANGLIIKRLVTLKDRV